MKKSIPLFLLLGLFLFSNSSFAAFDTFKASSWTTKETYSDKVIDKLGFGLLNLTAGWTAIPYEIDRHKDSNIYTGVFKGIYRNLTNTIGGAIHTVTFPIPVDVPLPDGGVHFD